MEFTESQLKVINHGHDPKTVLSVQAGPGTGKTFTLVHRVKKLLETGVDPEEIVVLSMTTRTVYSFKTALANLIGEQAEKIKIHTFHGYANHLTEQNTKDYFPQRESQILVNDNSFSGYTDLFLGSTGLRYTMLEKAILAAKCGDDLNKVAKKYNIEKARLQDTIRRFQENGILRYLDFITSAIELITVSQGKIVKDVKVLIIDEFQDMQPDLVRFVEKLIQYDEKHITLAGDHNQCIYEFLGSYPEITDTFMSRLNWQKDQILLKESFRLTPENMGLANIVIPELQLQPTKEPSAEPMIQKFDSHDDEYAFIGDEIARLILELGGLLKFSDFAILTRTNDDVEKIANYMASEYGYGVNKYTLYNDWVRSRVHIFLDVLDILRKSKGSDMALLYILRVLGVTKATLKRVYDDYEKWNIDKKNRFEDFLKLPDSNNSFNTARRKASKSIIDHFLTLVQEERKDFMDPISVMTSLSRITRETKIMDFLNEVKKNDHTNSAVRLTQNIESFYKTLSSSYEQEPSLEYFLRNYQDEEPRSEDGSINISTVHKAKGLEFPVVFVTSSKFDYFKSQQNRRLLYVAMTRAKSLLYCSLPPESFNREVGVNPVYMNPTWIKNTARDLKRVVPTGNHVRLGQRILKTATQLI